MTEMEVDLVVAVAVRQQEAKLRQGQAAMQHLDKAIMVGLKQSQACTAVAVEEKAELEDLLRLEAVGTEVLVIVILELPMLVVGAEAHKVEQEEQAEAEEEEMAERQHKMVLMDRQTWVVAAAAEAQLDKLAALEVAGLL
jgi:hypothetical protein